MNATLEHIWHEFADRLRKFIRSRVTDPWTAEDILQDVFVRIRRRLDQLHDPARLESWIYSIARNAIIDHYRTRKETVELPETLPAEPGAPDGDVEELKATFRRMIYSVPESYREALVLTAFESLTQQQPADRLGISLSGAKSRTQRGRKQLKQLGEGNLPLPRAKDIGRGRGESGCGTLTQGSSYVVRATLGYSL